MRLRTCLAAIVLAGLSACAQPPAATKEPEQKPPTASELAAKVEAERKAGRSAAALQAAHDLISRYGATPEGTAAAKSLPALEAEAQAAAEAERKRAELAAAEAREKELKAKWSYSVSEDAMTGKTARSARIESENTVSFGFPYQGEQHAGLTLRDHPKYGRDVILAIEKGQFLCPSWDGCEVMIRFDDGQPQDWHASPAADNDSTVIFIRNADGFLQRMKAAKVVRVQPRIYQEGEPIFEFRVSGFDLTRYGKG
ncbi:MAG: hypothetical protein IPJ17_16655 [Holophagales bacterium]|nr:MAG: hypothetical protein IPJ17_16655 [Holophagales bacterium]